MESAFSRCGSDEPRIGIDCMMLEKMDQLPWYYKVLAHAIYYLEGNVELPIEWFKALTAKIDGEHESNAKDIESKLSRANKTFYRNLIRHKEKAIHIE